MKRAGVSLGKTDGIEGQEGGNNNSISCGQ